MVLLKAVEADGEDVESGLSEFVEFLVGEEHSVGDHAPHVAFLADFGSALGYVFADEGFAACGYDYYFVGVVGLGDFVECRFEEGEWHVVFFGEGSAVAAAVEAVDVAAEGAFPE